MCMLDLAFSRDQMLRLDDQLMVRLTLVRLLLTLGIVALNCCSASSKSESVVACVGAYTPIVFFSVCARVFPEEIIVHA